MAVIIDGKKIADELKAELKIEIEKLREQTGSVPGLVTILVGKSGPSLSYVNSKLKYCHELGMHSALESLDESITEENLLSIINKYNNDSSFHGILVQLPLPEHISEDKVIEAINPLKDVDGFHPISIGNLVIGKKTFYPCTPYGIVEMLLRYGIETKGKHVVVVGRSNIVGKPIANMMLQKKEGANAIVTICHSAAKDLKSYTQSADILIAAIGVPNFIKADMVREGVVVIDVGINRVDDPASKKGYRVVGDVDFESVEKKASYITPVPGGVGLMTVAMLMKNTVISYKEFKKLQ